MSIGIDYHALLTILILFILIPAGIIISCVITIYTPTPYHNNTNYHKDDDGNNSNGDSNKTIGIMLLSLLLPSIYLPIIICFIRDKIRQRYRNNEIQLIEVIGKENDNNKIKICPYCRTCITDTTSKIFENEEECSVCLINKKDFILFNSCTHKICNYCFYGLIT